MTRDDFLYHSARIISYPTWIAAVTVGILLAAGVVNGSAWVVTLIILLGVAMPIGVKLSRMELTKTMLAVFETAIALERTKREKREKP